MDKLKLHRLLTEKNLEEIKKFISENPEVLTKPGEFSQSILDDAICCSSYEIIKFLIEAGANTRYSTAGGYTAIHSAIERERPDKTKIIKLLVEKGADINARGFNDWTPLHKAAASDNIELVKLLVKLGADITVRTRIDDYATPAEEARNLGKNEIADYLFGLQNKD